MSHIRASPAFSSQTRHGYGRSAKEHRENQAEFRCVSCGHINHTDINHTDINHTDINAAENILARGPTLLASTPGQGASQLTPAARVSQSKDRSENSVEAVAA